MRSLSLKRNIVLGAAFGIVFGVAFDNLSIGIVSGVALGLVLDSKMRVNESSSNQKIQLSDEAAEAMASKIKFEAEQHRKNRDGYNYIKMNNEKEE